MKFFKSQISSSYKTRFLKQQIYYLPFFFFLFLMFLAFFRYPISDELLYLIETSFIKKLFLNKIWIANYSIGTHGFLFKTPIALLFMITGNSIWIATISTILFAVASLYLMRKLLKLYFKDDLYIFSGLLLLGTSYHFIRSSVTYIREMPVLFFCLVFYYLVARNSKKYYIGLALLLVLEAKEYVFFQIAPGYIVWLFLSAFFLNQKKIIGSLKVLLKNLVLVFSPVVIYIGVMLFTELIPLNVFLAYIVGALSCSETAFDSSAILLTSGGAYSGTSSSAILNMSIIGAFALQDSVIACWVKGNIQSSSYLFKVFYPRVFSFLSTPLFVAMPVFWTIIRKIFVILRDKKNTRNINELVFPMIIIFFFITYYLRESHGRYLFSLTPLLVLYFLKYLKSISNANRQILLFIITCIFTLFGGLFEVSYIMPKFLINMVMLLFWGLIIYEKLPFKEDTAKFFYMTFIALTLGTIATASLCLLRNGQFDLYRQHGFAGQINRVSEQMDKKSSYFVNFDVGMLKFYQDDPMKSHFKYPRWKLRKSFSRAENMKNSLPVRIHYFDLCNMEITANILIKLQPTGLIIEKKNKQDCPNLASIQRSSSYKLKKQLKIKGRKIYFFDII